MTHVLLMYTSLSNNVYCSLLPSPIVIIVSTNTRWIGIVLNFPTQPTLTNLHLQICPQLTYPILSLTVLLNDHSINQGWRCSVWF